MWPSQLGLALILGAGLGLAAPACGDSGGSDCQAGTLGCSCYPGAICLAGLTCLSQICVDIGDGGITGPGDGDGDGGTGNGDTGPGDGDGDTGPGDGDGDGDGDGGPAGDPCGVSSEVLLYNQGYGYSNDPGLIVGTFVDINNGSRVELADEFVIPQDESCWCITRVLARGFYKDEVAPANFPNVSVEFFDHNPAGVPYANLTASYTGPATEPEQSGFLDVAITEPIILEAGTHWLSFSPFLTYAETSWYWKVHNELYGFVAAARDEDGILFNGACTGWTPATACFSSSPDYADYADITMQFEIYGVIGGEDCN